MGCVICINTRKTNCAPAARARVANMWPRLRRDCPAPSCFIIIGEFSAEFEGLGRGDVWFELAIGRLHGEY